MPSIVRNVRFVDGWRATVPPDRLVRGHPDLFPFGVFPAPQRLRLVRLVVVAFVEGAFLGGEG